MLSEKLNNIIRDVPDFPKPGILFKDITPIFHNAELCHEITNALSEVALKRKIDAIAGIESRGFFFGFTVAQKLNIPFVPIRKAGKLPYKTDSCEYNLEYGTAKIEMHIDAIKAGWKVMIHDDLLATGGTVNAATELVKKQKGIVDCYSFLVELSFLNGRKNLNGDILSLITF